MQLRRIIDPVKDTQEIGVFFSDKEAVGTCSLGDGVLEVKTTFRAQTVTFHVPFDKIDAIYTIRSDAVTP